MPQGFIKSFSQILKAELAYGLPWLQTPNCNPLLISNKPIFDGGITDSLFVLGKHLSLPSLLFPSPGVDPKALPNKPLHVNFLPRVCFSENPPMIISLCWQSISENLGYIRIWGVLGITWLLSLSTPDTKIIFSFPGARFYFIPTSKNWDSPSASTSMP